MTTTLEPQRAEKTTQRAVAVLGIVAVFLATAFGSEFQMQQWAQWLIFCMLAVSLVWVWGHTGIFSFAQVAFFGIGAYVYGVVGINLSPLTGETLSALIIGVAVAALFAALLGYFLFYGRISDVFVAISTLAVALVLNTLMMGTADPRFTIGSVHLGGFNGMAGVPPLMVKLPWQSDGIFFYGKNFFILLGVLAVIMAYVVARVRSSSFGRVLGAIRENEDRATLLGINVPKYKVLAFMLGAVVAGFAGALFAAWGNFIDPTVFGLQMATLLMVWVFAGGQTSLVGAFVGVFVIQKLSDAIVSTGTTITPLVLGGILIAIVIVLPRGIVPTVISAFRRKRNDMPESLQGESKDDSVDERMLRVPESVLPETGAQLSTEGLKKLFGGVAAVNGVSLQFDSKGVCCLVGPNGAGKSTFFRLLVGLFPASSGSIAFDGQDITNRDMVWRVQNGMSIKAQVLSLFPKLSIRENLWIAAYAKSRDSDDAMRVTDDLLAWLGYEGERSEIPVDTIAHGNQQWVDIAMALAQRPKLLLLDEPAAGMGKEETLKLAALARTVGKKIPVLIVEHDMVFVRETGASNVVVFHQGEVLTTGTLAEIQSDERVLQVYLGRK